MLRLFTGLSLPAPVCQRLALLQGGIPGARWIPPGNFHITLTFIGSADAALAEDIDGALSGVRASGFSLRLKGVGNFAQGDDPKVLWAALADQPALHALKDKADRALEMARVPFDKKKYIPHVTLARFRRPDEEKIVDFMHAHTALETQAFDVFAFHLYQSHQTKNGSVYEILRSYPLLGSP